MHDHTSDLAYTARTIIQSSNIQRQADLRLFHYNDVYHVEAGSRAPVGGAARLQTLYNFYASGDRFEGQPKLLTFFSGDSLNPSLESTITKGKHMISVLNSLGTNAACLGNHDLDFGVEQFVRLAKDCHFPWLCSNVLDASGVPLGSCQRTKVVTASNGLKIGLIGLVEREWLDTILDLPPDLQYMDPSHVAEELVPQLKAQGVQMVIALAHQRMHNDRRLAEKLPPGTIDIILGGHDHTYEYAMVNGTPVLRSGSDFKQFSYIEGYLDGQSWKFDIVRHDVVSSIPPDEAASKMIDHITDSLASTLQKVIGSTAVALDARTATVRKAESNLGNLICDIMRLHYRTDCSIICGGTIRSDDVIPPGVLRVKDIMNCLPFEDTCVIVRLPGSAIVEALENGVSAWPSEDGRISQVSGISFAFDPLMPATARCSDIRIRGEPVDMDKEYSMVTRDYMSLGKDGYHMLMPVSLGGKATITQAGEHGVMLSTLLRHFLASLRVLDQWTAWEEVMASRWQAHHDYMLAASAMPLRRLDDGGVNKVDLSPQWSSDNIHAGYGGLRRLDSDQELCKADIDAARDEEHRGLLSRKYAKRWRKIAGVQVHALLVDSNSSLSNIRLAGGVAIAPKVEGRIRIIQQRD